MNSILQNQVQLAPGFTKRSLRRYDCELFGVHLPAFSVRKMGSGLVVDLSLDTLDPNSTIGSTLTQDVIVEAGNIMNFIHNFTFGHLAGVTDEPFAKKFPIMNDGFDHMTPDLIVETPAGGVFVIEFTTNRGNSAQAEASAMAKFGKYEIACEVRSSTRPVSLSVISAHRRGVVSNLELETAEVDEIVFRFRLAVAIFEEFKMILPSLDSSDEETTRVENEVKGILASINMNWQATEESFPHFKEKVFSVFRNSLIDEDYISTIISKSLTECQEEMKTSAFLEDGQSFEERCARNHNEAVLEVEKAKSAFYREGRMRSIYDSKATVQIPGWVTYPGAEGKGLESLQQLDVFGDHPMCTIWQKVCLAADSETIDRMFDDVDGELEFALSGTPDYQDRKPDRADERNRYHRVRIDLSREEEEYVASFGVCGKSHKDDSFVKEARDRSKLCFRPDHSIEDLENFLYSRDNSIFAESFCLYSPLTEDVDLRRMAHKIHQPKLLVEKGENEMLSAHIKFMNSPIGSWSQMVSLIGAELSASVKQHVKPKYFVIKRLMGSDIFLLIKPTSSKSHIFVSFAVKKSALQGLLWADGVFKSYIDSGDLFVTDFVSYRLSKLTNLCKCNSLLECSSAFWTECFGGFPWELTEFLSGSDVSGLEAAFMTKMSLLTLMEDKATTEEMQTIMRYIMMEGFVSQPEIPKPHKMCSKFPKVLRTELQVFLLKRLGLSISEVAKNPFRLQKKDGSITWGNLFNPLSGRPVRDLQPLISACYNGYFKNKEEETEPSALSKMYKKIIELESAKPDTDENLGLGDPYHPSTHEFSRSYLKRCCEHGLNLLKRQYGQNVLDQIDSQILREVSSLTLERLATLKATSKFDEGWYVFKDVADKNYTRDKLIVRMSEFASEGKTLAIEKFEECMSRIESRGAMHICLFKKQQHGGLREIYVLGAEERIVQCLVEAIAKTIGKFFASDTLCNPPNKMKIPESHGSRARKHCGGPIWTTATSDDAKKWNQGHFTLKFALMLCEFTRPRWWPIIIRGCSMFTKKRMMMNLRYLSILHGHRELNVDDEFVMTLFSAYHGEQSVPWMSEGRTYLETTTGMMQGILHFTSSLLHTLHQEFIRSLSFKIFNMRVHPEMSTRIVCDMMQGSDDSSMLISFPAENESLLIRCKVAAALCFRMKKKLGVFLAIYPSEKSTSNTDFAMEYNSEFFFHTRHVRPTIRWIAACCSLPEVETLVARQEEASNLMTSVPEGGGSFSLAAMVQQAQCTLHYMLMGMGMSRLFPVFSREIQKWMDPGLGFFLFDNPFCAGLGGFRFNLYKAIMRTELKVIYTYFMKNIRDRDTEDWDDATAQIPETCSVSPGGAIVMSSSLKWGSKQKFDKLRDRLNIPCDWIERINEIPDVLYRAPRSGEEIILRIAEKVHSPGVVSSLSSGNAVCKVIASSVYFLSAAIFQDSGKQEGKVLPGEKYSLLRKMAAYEGFRNVDRMHPDDILFLFPNVEELEALDAIVGNRGEIEVIRRMGLREATQTRVVVFDHSQTSRASPEKLVSDKWFGTQKSKIGRTMLENEWARLKRTIRWLDDTPEETLKRTPLQNHIQIRNFFARLEGRSRTVRVTGAPVKKRSGISKLSLVIRDNFCRNGFLKGIEDVSGSSRAVTAEALKHTLFCILQGPYPEEYKLQYTQRVLLSFGQIDIKPGDGKTKSNLLAIMQKFMNNDDDLPRVIEEVGAGIIGGFIRAQKSERRKGQITYYGEGSWRGVMDGVQIQIDIYNKPGEIPQITSVTMKDPQSPWDLGPSIRSWAEDVGVSNSLDFAAKCTPGARYWITGFKVFGPSHPYGAPVYVISTSMTRIVNLETRDIKMKIRNHTINLYTKSGYRGGDMHITSYTSGDSDLSPESLKALSPSEREVALSCFAKEPSNSWVMCNPIPEALIEAVLGIVGGERSIPSIDPVRLSEIIQKCTEASVRQKVGTLFNTVISVEESDCRTNIDDIIDIIIEDTNTISFETIAQQMSSDMGDTLTSPEFDNSDVNLFGPAHYKEISGLAMISHPLMDSFVDHVVERMGRSNVRSLLEQNTCSTPNLALSRLLYKSLGRNPDIIKVQNIKSTIITDVTDDMLG
ncbi:RNA-dependent RNA polymerase [Ntepes virus]|uniref:RNA-directed RNA polymerase L n=1 Tax=Ntepes virus TaxID=2569589 RepID=A0A499S7X0_9VIRU|nr:RNA-dependent RNA polymerase [Ntepes virus]AYC35226.1 RNA-dependent RNA polymerase [Ntepes virus]